MEKLKSDLYAYIKKNSGDNEGFYTNCIKYQTNVILADYLKGFDKKQQLSGKIAKFAQQNWFYKQFKTAKEVKEAFEEKNLDFLFFKGFILSDMLYQNQCDRKSWDLDVLIDKNDLGKYLSALEALGYKICEIPWYIEKNITIEEYIEIEHVTMHKENSGVPVELHSYPLYVVAKEYRDSFRMLRDKIYYEVGGEVFPTLSLEDQLINYLVHFSKDYFWNCVYNRLYSHKGGTTRIDKLFDIAVFAEKYRNKINWHIFTDRIITMDCQNIALISINMVQEIFGNNIFNTHMLQKLEVNAVKHQLSWSEQFMYTVPVKNLVLNDINKYIENNFLYSEGTKYYIKNKNEGVSKIEINNYTDEEGVPEKIGGEYAEICWDEENIYLTVSQNEFFDCIPDKIIEINDLKPLFGISLEQFSKITNHVFVNVFSVFYSEKAENRRIFEEFRKEGIDERNVNFSVDNDQKRLNFIIPFSVINMGRPKPGMIIALELSQLFEKDGELKFLTSSRIYRDWQDMSKHAVIELV